MQQTLAWAPGTVIVQRVAHGWENAEGPGQQRPCLNRNWSDPKCDGEIQTHTQTHTHMHSGKQMQSQKVENPGVYRSEWSESHSVVSNSLWPHGLYSPWNSPGQNTGVGRHSLLHGIFPTQGSNPGFLHCRRILYQLSHQESPRMLECIAYPFSSRSSQPRNRTRGLLHCRWIL